MRSPPTSASGRSRSPWTAKDLPTLHRRLEANESAVLSFLKTRFPDDEARAGEAEVVDRHQQGMYTDERYQGKLTVTLRTDQVDKLHAAMAETDALIAEGVALVREWSRSTSWMFTGLDGIKPDMIAEATRDARRAAEQFARDAESAVGPIQRANQGYFSIEDRDPFSPEVKRVRVVTTITFLLDD